jgi:putative colanic acid biosynthesis UDP-glucose lipid carrier transferase
MMFATQDRSISRLFLGTFLGGSWLGLTWLHQALPPWLTRLLYRQAAGIPTLFIGRVELLPQLADWLAQRMQLGLQPVGFLSLDQVAPPTSLHSAVPFAGQLTELRRILSEKNISQVILLELPASAAVARQIIADCQVCGCRLLVQHQVDQLLGHPVESVDEGGIISLPCITSHWRSPLIARLSVPLISCWLCPWCS